MEYYNHTGWAVGQEFTFPLPANFFVKVEIEDTHFRELDDGMLDLTGPNDPVAAVIKCRLYMPSYVDGNKVWAVHYVDRNGHKIFTEEEFHEQADFFKWIAAIQKDIREELEQMEIQKEFTNNLKPHCNEKD